MTAVRPSSLFSYFLPPYLYRQEERLFGKQGRREEQEMAEKITVPIKDKFALTIAEAAAYSGISESVLRNRIANSNYDFILMNGTKTLIKRRMFEKYLESVDAI